MSRPWGSVESIAELHRLGKLPLIIRGRPFDLHDLRVVLQSTSKHFDKGRTYISQDVCTKLGWTQPNGWLKDRACRDVLRRLQELGLISLPAMLATGARPAPGESAARLRDYDQRALIRHLRGPIRLKLAKGTSSEKVWNTLVGRYHYLGHSTSVGRCLKYLVTVQDQVLGAISFSSPAWRLKPRDDVLRSLNIDPSQAHDLVINNNRFLVLPGVLVEHFASRVLGLATRQVVQDWFNYYLMRPLIAETFVSSSRFDGTCYRAANWIAVGRTRGYAKRGAIHRNGQEVKQVFLYPLTRRLRVRLTRYAREHDDASRNGT